ncbi:MAG TPA: cytochrome P450 [Candidatus Binatia bacterium]|jgi:cytochrome P450|nr:cytochrome P450 [Candidatus Binatia bacterium]
MQASRPIATSLPRTPALPPGPSAPAAVQTLRLVRHPYDFLERCARDFGDAFTLRTLGQPPSVVMSHPDAIREIFTADPDVLSAGESNAPFLAPILGENSVLVLDGARHLRKRRLLLPPLHGERMQAYAVTMRDLTDVVVDAWPVGQPFPILASMQRITLDVIIRTVFGVETSGTTGRLREALFAMLGMAGSLAALSIAIPALRIELGGLAPWGRFRRHRATFDRILREEIAARRQAGTEGRTDILSLLLEARDEDGEPMSDAELLDEMFTLLMAGHETTAAALAWAFHHVLVEPAVVTRLRAELAAVVGGGRLEPWHLSRLEYVDAVVKETLRVFPIIPSVVRRVKAPVRIGGWDVPAGATVSAAIYLAHRRADSWPEPDCFVPERFLGARPSPYAFLPFGGGTRRCLGAAFASYEMKVVLATTFLRAELREAPGYRMRPVSRGFAVAPSEGTPVVLEHRRP